jgi:hypothetical protein
VPAVPCNVMADGATLAVGAEARFRVTVTVIEGFAADGMDSVMCPVSVPADSPEIEGVTWMVDGVVPEVGVRVSQLTSTEAAKAMAVVPAGVCKLIPAADGAALPTCPLKVSAVGSRVTVVGGGAERMNVTATLKLDGLPLVTWNWMLL